MNTPTQGITAREPAYGNAPQDVIPPSSTELPIVAFIDDEVNILKSVRRGLRQAPFEIRTTTDREELYTWLKHDNVSVVVSDQRMPECNGTDVLEMVRHLSPNTVKILMTGYADIQASIDAINRGNIYKYLSKPWNDEDLAQVLLDAVAVFQDTQEQSSRQQAVQEQNLWLMAENKRLAHRMMQQLQQSAQQAQHKEPPSQTLSSPASKAPLTDERSFQQLQDDLQMVLNLSQMLPNYQGETRTNWCRKLLDTLKASKTSSAQVGSPPSSETLTPEQRLQLEIAARLMDWVWFALPEPERLTPFAQLRLLHQQTVLHQVRRLKDILNRFTMFDEGFEYLEKSLQSSAANPMLRQNIPLGARVLAVAHRYTQTLTLSGTQAQTDGVTVATLHPGQSLNIAEHALTMIHQGNNRLLDPEIVGALYKLVGEQVYHAETDMEPFSVQETEAHAVELTGGVIELNPHQSRPEIPEKFQYLTTEPKGETSEQQPEPPPEPVMLYVHQLKPGMRLAQDVLNNNGGLLLPKDSVIDFEHLPGLHALLGWRRNTGGQQILVYPGLS